MESEDEPVIIFEHSNEAGDDNFISNIHWEYENCKSGWVKKTRGELCSLSVTSDLEIQEGYFALQWWSSTAR